MPVGRTRLYGRWDTVNAFLVTRGLAVATGGDAGLHKREYAITEEGLEALGRLQSGFVDRRRRNEAVPA